MKKMYMLVNGTLLSIKDNNAAAINDNAIAMLILKFKNNNPASMVTFKYY